jgi:carboxypeptidase C (cathepsin A)
MAHETTGTPTGSTSTTADHSEDGAAGSGTAPGTAPGTATTPAPPADDLVTTRHTLKVGRRSLRYRATTGRVVLREEVYKDGVFTGVKPKAEMSMTAYVLEGSGGKVDPSRPVTFAFNGGPGSSSVWLHLGLLGPRRVDAGDVGATTPPPYGLLDNPQTLLAVSDLVFIDPVSTGFSRAVEGGTPKDYHGFTADISSVGELIRLWTTREGRWLSPKFVIGESYGTTRAAALADHLQSIHGMYLNGVMLISSVLDFGTLDFEFRNDRASVDFLPTYAAVAHFHGKHGRRSLSSVLKEAEAYADRDYPWALARGHRLTVAERAEAVATLARLTGLSPQWVDRADLRIEHMRFYAELLRDQGLVVGRLDSRFTGPLAAGNAETADTDPSHDAMSGPYAAAWNHYVRVELGYQSDLAYTQLSMKASEEWSFKEFEAKPVDVSSQMARAMRANPDLKVHVASGYLDGATPYYGAQDVFAHLQVPKALADGVEHRFYEAGHMMYVHEPSRVRQSADLADFVRRASGG